MLFESSNDYVFLGKNLRRKMISLNKASKEI
jgi:hypothetical protein